MIKIKDLEEKIDRINKMGDLDIIINRIENQNNIDKIKSLSKIEITGEEKLQILQNKLRHTKDEHG